MSIVAIGLAIVTTTIHVDGDPVLSLIAGIEPGKVTFDWGQIRKLSPWVAVLLVTVLGQTFPELWNWLGVMLERLLTP